MCRHDYANSWTDHVLLIILITCLFFKTQNSIELFIGSCILWAWSISCILWACGNLSNLAWVYLRPHTPAHTRDREFKHVISWWQWLSYETSVNSASLFPKVHCTLHSAAFQPLLLFKVKQFNVKYFCGREHYTFSQSVTSQNCFTSVCKNHSCLLSMVLVKLNECWTSLLST